MIIFNNDYEKLLMLTVLGFGWTGYSDFFIIVTDECYLDLFVAISYYIFEWQSELFAIKFADIISSYYYCVIV